MEQGAFTRDGFLSDDPMGLDRVEVDARILAEAGITREEVGSALQELWQKARVLMGEAFEPVPGVIVDVKEARGRIACPFGHPGIYAKGVMSVEYRGHTLQLSPLSIHMIRAHGFFGGRGGFFRVEPENLVELVRAF